MNNKLEKIRLIDLLPDVEQKLDSDVKGWRASIAAYQKKVAEGKAFPRGVELISIDNIWIDYSVQRDVKPKHVGNIMKKFDPRICMPAAGVVFPDEGNDKIYIYDGQHRMVSCAMLGIKEIPVCIVETDDKTFPAMAFEICNDTGIAKASKEDIHRVLMHRWTNGNDEAREDPRVRLAYKIQSCFDVTGIDLEGHGTRKSKKRGNNDYFFSHFQYAGKVYEGVGKDRLVEILANIKSVYADEEEINQGLFIGLSEMLKIANAQNDLAELPKDWMRRILTVVKRATGDATNFTQASRDQWKHHRGNTDGGNGMAAIMREVFKANCTSQEYFVVPYVEKFAVGILDNNLCSRFKSMLDAQAQG